MVKTADVISASGFARMPFRIVPPTDMDHIIWAGDRSIIDGLLFAAKSPREDELATSELVVIWGDYGSGKTNALKYLSKELREAGELVAYIPRPAITDKPMWSLLVREMFSACFLREDVVRRLTRLKNWVGQEALRRVNEEHPDGDPQKAMSQKQSEIFSEILPEKPGFVEFLMDLVANKPGDLNWKFLTGSMTPKESGAIAGKYGISSEGMGSDHGATELLAYFVRVMTHTVSSPPGSDVVYLLFDECEGLNDLSSAGRQSILIGLRDLFNLATEHLFLALALTASDASELWGVFDEPLMHRLSRRPMAVPQLDPSEAKAFMLDIMGQNRKPDYQGAPEWPFSEDGLDAFVNSCPPPLTPRKLLVSAQRCVFQKYAVQVAQGTAVQAADVSDFADWGMGA